jgi:protein CMS1
MKADTLTGGDDLEDDLDLQPDFMVASDAEDDDEGDAIMSNGDEEDLPDPLEGGDVGDFLSDNDEETGAATEVVGKKRKAEEERPTNVGSSGGPSTALSDADKKKKRKLKEKERKEKVGQSNFLLEFAHSRLKMLIPDLMLAENQGAGGHPTL